MRHPCIGFSGSIRLPFEFPATFSRSFDVSGALRNDFCGFSRVRPLFSIGSYEGLLRQMTTFDKPAFLRLASHYGYQNQSIWVFPRGDIRTREVSGKADKVYLERRVDCGPFYACSGSLLYPFRDVTGLNETPHRVALPFTDKKAPRVNLRLDSRTDFDKVGRLSESFTLYWGGRYKQNKVYVDDPQTVECAEGVVQGLFDGQEFLQSLFDEWEGHPEVMRLARIIRGYQEGVLS